MKKIFFLFLVTIALNASAQIYEPVEWATSVEKASEKEFVLIATATIEEGWHLYSQNVPEDGPIATTFTYEEIYGMEVVDKTSEGEGHEVYDNVFEMDIKYFENKAVFKQKVKLNQPHGGIINGVVEFMVCNDKSCLPPKEVELTFNLK